MRYDDIPTGKPPKHREDFDDWETESDRDDRELSNRIWFCLLVAGIFVAMVIAGMVTAAAQRPCLTCGVVHGSAITQAAQVAPANGGLDLLNDQRRARGLGALVADAALMDRALEKATIAARRGITGHIGGSLGGANKEGAGWSSGQRQFAACYQYTAPAGTPAGAAIVKGYRGWHSVLLIKHNGYLPSGKTRRRRLFR